MRTNQRIKYGLITGAGLICLALLISWWLGNFELVEEQYRAGVSLEARRNPLLAVELFLREMGADVESVNGSSPLQKLPPPSDILLLNKFDGNLSPERERKLLDWINAGGQLFITANSLWNEKRKTSGNRFLDDLGVHLRLAKDIKATGLNQGENAVIDLNQNENVIVKVDFDDGSSARVAFNKYYYLEDSKKLASVSVGDESGVHMLQIPYGNGLITITSDNHFLNNPETFSFAGLTIENTSIADNDHAYFLWHLLDRNRKIWLIYNIHPPAITSLLWEKVCHTCDFLALVDKKQLRSSHVCIRSAASQPAGKYIDEYNLRVATGQGAPPGMAKQEVAAERDKIQAS